MKERLRIIFGEGFRVFFLAAGLYAIFAVAVWEGWLGVHAAGGTVSYLPFAHAPHLWHAHEMIFGYATAALGGFFLTAVPNWTDTTAARHVFIILAAGVWFAGRLANWWSGHIDPLIVAVIDLAFLPILASKIASQLLRRPKPQNLIFLGILTIIWTGNLLVHLEWTGTIGDGVERGLRVGLFGIAALISVLGGRVTPAFTRNAMTRSGITTGLPRTNSLATAFGVSSAIILPVLLAIDAANIVIAVAAIIAGASQALRLAGWRSLWTLDQPILWSLHLAYAMLAMGYLLFGLSAVEVVNEIAALHLVGVGAVGGMTMAVMSRAILGHTGRQLIAPRRMTIAYGLIACAALARVSGTAVPVGWEFAAMLVSGALWIVAFSLFILVFWPALTTQRISRADAD